jgi:glycosyltransferase involved in cell wall biosynthesis
MKIAFVDTIDWDYRIESAYQRPLGGSQSALCYLAEALAQHNHEVFLLNQTLVSGMSKGVTCLNLDRVSREILQGMDVAIALNSTGNSKSLRSQFGKQTSFVLWTQHDINQPAMQPLLDRHEQDIYDAIVCISEWQRQAYCSYFGIHPDRITVFRNAIAPVFVNQFDPDANILSQKSEAPILAYTSTPFRGLDILLDVFPIIRTSIPTARLQIFSSMKVYQTSDATDKEQFGSLYQRCQNMEGVEYIGSLPQPELARALKPVSVLAYPNTFPETSCIAVMEAIASGCKVITSALGALPETTHGFADLIPIANDPAVYKQQFVDATVEFLRDLQSDRRDLSESRLKEQIHYINQSATWSIRASEWSKWLIDLTEKRQSAILLAWQKLEDEVEFYEQAIANQPEITSNYWQLGLTLLLLQREEDAQMVWFSAIADGTPDEIEQWTAELVIFLKTEAANFFSQGDSAIELVVRQQIYAIAPADIDNLLALGNLSLEEGRAEQAIAYFYDLLTSQPDRSDSSQIVIGMAKAYQGQGKIGFVKTEYLAELLPDDAGLKLNLGCGENYLEGFVSVDKFGNPDVKCDLEVFPWQWADNSVSEVYLNHILEYLGATADIYFKIFKELYRICLPNARIQIKVPHPRHDDFINDPRHIRVVTPEGLQLFSLARNREWIAANASNSPLGIHLGVDFELVLWSYELEEPWRSQYICGKIGATEIMQMLKQFNNVAKQIEMELRVIKD